MGSVILHHAAKSCTRIVLSHMGMKTELSSCRIPWDNLLLRAPPEGRLVEIEKVLGELEFRQHAQRFTKIWAAMRSAEEASAAAGLLH